MLVRTFLWGAAPLWQLDLWVGVHAARLLCRIRVTGKELPGRRVALQVQVTSCLSCTAAITGVTLDPQPGFSCEQKPPELASLLPLTVSSPCLQPGDFWRICCG